MAPRQCTPPRWMFRPHGRAQRRMPQPVGAGHQGAEVVSMQIRRRVLAIAAAAALTVGTAGVATAQGLVEYGCEPSFAGKIISALARTPDASPADFIKSVRATSGKANGWGQHLRAFHQACCRQWWPLRNSENPTDRSRSGVRRDDEPVRLSDTPQEARPARGRPLLIPAPPAARSLRAGVARVRDRRNCLAHTQMPVRLTRA